jgi:hypothetical protein
LSKVDFKAWIKGADVPVRPNFTSTKLEEVIALADQYIALGGDSSPEGSEGIP